MTTESTHYVLTVRGDGPQGTNLRRREYAISLSQYQTLTRDEAEQLPYVARDFKSIERVSVSMVTHVMRLLE